MKFSLVALFSTAAITVSAGTPDIWPSHWFSRKAMSKWREHLLYDSVITEWYQGNMAQSKRQTRDDPSRPSRTATCPAKLRDANIQIVSAEGAYRKLDRNKMPILTPTKDTGDLNDITYVYLINEGICGKLVARTELGHGDLGFYGYHWTEAALTVPDIPSDRGIDMREVKFSAGKAFKKVLERFKGLRYGFVKLSLKKMVLKGVDQSVYIFEVIREGKEITEIHVSATTGYADVNLGQPEK